jgi:predicted amino acid-binding ACT domain protein
LKSFEFTKIEGNRIKIDRWLSDIMGLVDGGYIYSTLFQYPEEGPKRYELLLSMYPQENLRNLAHITMYTEDVPGATVQAASFLTNQKIRILNSVSLTGISDTTIVWNILGELNFAGEGDLLTEHYQKLREARDPSVDKIKFVSVKPTSIGRIFRERSSTGGLKKELRKGAPMTYEDGYFDLGKEYGDILGDMSGQNAMITVDPGMWIVSVVIFKEDTDLVKIDMDIPDCMGSVDTALKMMADAGVNLISVFTKVMISYQTMDIEVVADLKGSKYSADDIEKKLPEYLSKLNGVYELKKIERL